MKKIMGLMAILVGTAALAVPAMAAECVVVRRDVPVRHEMRRDVREVRDVRVLHGQYERR